MGFDLGIGEAAALTALEAAAADAAAATAATVGTTAAATTAAAAGTAATALSIAPEALALGAGANFAIDAAAAGGAAAAGAGAAGGSLASTLSTAGLVSSGASGLLGAAGAMRTAQAQKDSANYQAQVALNNRNIAGYQASQAAAKGAEEQERLGLRQKQQSDLILASQAANNIDIGSGGSAEDVRRSQRALGQLDALQLQHNTAQQIYGYQLAGSGFEGNADLLKSQAAYAGASGPLNAAGSILSAASAASNQYLNWMRVAGSSTNRAAFV